jgi:hypothetical protein
MTNKDIKIIIRIKDWYLMDHGNYIRVYDAMKSPHLLPQFIPDKIVLQKVAYQTIIHGVRGMLYMFKKVICPHYLYTLTTSFSRIPNEPKWR